MVAIFLDCECPSAFLLVPLGPFALYFFLPPTAPALRQAHHPADPPQGEGRGLFTAPPEQNQCEHLPCETFSNQWGKVFASCLTSANLLCYLLCAQLWVGTGRGRKCLWMALHHSPHSSAPLRSSESPWCLQHQLGLGFEWVKRLLCVDASFFKAPFSASEPV